MIPVIEGKVVAFCGGVGGARMASGLAQIVAPGNLTCIVNVADDFDHLGLRICPDLDTVLYTLADRENPEMGWGCRDETQAFMNALSDLGGEGWFQLGDRDLATHVLRTHALGNGERLTQIMARFANELSVFSHILPVTDDPVTTLCETDEGTLEFQDYFVRRRCEPSLTSLIYNGSEQAEVTPEVIAALADPELVAVVICPSNPYLSIDPILSIGNMKKTLVALACPLIAISPIINAAAVKGPLAKIMNEFGVAVSAHSIAHHYLGLADHFLVDPADANFNVDGITIHACDVMMRNQEGRARLAGDVARCLNRGKLANDVASS